MTLTAKEAMTFAANLKLGYKVSQEYKQRQVILLLLTTLMYYNNYNYKICLMIIQ